MGRNNRRRRKMKATARRQGQGQGQGGQGAAFSCQSRHAGAPGGPEMSSAAQQARQTQERARDLVQLALWAVGRDPVTEERARGQLVQFARTDVIRGRAAGRQLAEALQGHLELAWRYGWEPVDLHRAVGRRLPSTSRLPAAVQDVLVDAMVADLGRYAADSVDPRWWAQLAELEASAWWPASSDHVFARASSAPDGWADVCAAVLRLIALVGRLPELAVLGPLPGRADAASRAASERGRAADERFLFKVRKLLAKAESTTFAAEAETFTAGAQALMARHSIDAAMVAAAEQSSSPPGAIRIGTDRPYESSKALLLDLVAGANRCRTVWSKELGFSTVLGFPPDLRAVETLFTSLLVQATAAVHREGSRQTARGQSRTRSFRQSFLTAYATRIGERLAEVARDEEDQARKRADVDRAGRSSGAGRDLLPVLVARSQAVDDATAQMFPDLRHHHAGRVNDAEGWHRGRAAADQADLGRARPLAAG